MQSCLAARSPMKGWMDGWAETGRQADWQRQADRQTGRQADMQTGRQMGADRRTEPPQNETIQQCVVNKEDICPCCMYMH